MTTTSLPMDEPASRALPGHYRALVDVLKRPRAFFAAYPVDAGLRRPLLFLCFSALFYTAVCVTYFLGSSPALALAVLVNALAMPAILAGITWMLLTMTTGHYGFRRVFGMYAYAAGALMLFSWIPMVGYACEAWKAALMACALSCGLGLGWGRSVVMVATTFLVVMLLLWAVLPVIGGISPLMAQ